MKRRVLAEVTVKSTDDRQIYSRADPATRETMTFPSIVAQQKEIDDLNEGRFVHGGVSSL